MSGVSCNIAALLGILLRPFMPVFSDEIFSQCHLPPERQTLAPIIANGGNLPCLLPEGHVIGQVSLFHLSSGGLVVSTYVYQVSVMS